MIFCSADASSDSCAAINDDGLAGKIGILHREDVGLREILRSPDPTQWQVFAKYGAELLLALWTREIGEAFTGIHNARYHYIHATGREFECLDDLHHSLRSANMARS